MPNLEGAKVGDMAAVCGHYSVEILRIVRVTPKGRVTLSDGRQFWPNGTLVGREIGAPRWARIATADDIERARQKAVLASLHKVNWYAVPPQVRDAVAAALAQCDRSPTGGDAAGGSVEDESAVATNGSDAPHPSARPRVNTTDIG